MTDQKVKYVQIDSAILYDQALKPAEKILLALVCSFNQKGLLLSNIELKKILNLHPGNISAMITRLESGGWLKITSKQSRYRKIYFSAGAKVDNDSTLAQNDPTLAQARVYFSAGAKQKGKKVKDIKEKHSSFPSACASKDAPAIPAQAPETKPAQAFKLPDDPATRKKLKDAFLKLGFPMPTLNFCGKRS